jgi:hypothetical protein
MRRHWPLLGEHTEASLGHDERAIRGSTATAAQRTCRSRSRSRPCLASTRSAVQRSGRSQPASPILG